MKYYIGIDPGKSPSVCVLNEDGSIKSCLLFKQSNSKEFPYYEYNAFMHFIKGLKLSGITPIITMELPHSVYGASAKANFQFGLSIGACMMGLEGSDFEVNYISPKSWTSWIWEDKDTVPKKVGKGRDTKATSLNSAKRILGDKWDISTFLPTQRSKVPNHNMVDAYLIAEYGRQLDSN